VLSINLIGTGTLLVISIREGHLRRALRWPRVCQALGLLPEQLESRDLSSITTTAEEVLQTIDEALPGVQGYLEPARRSTLEVVQRSEELSRLAYKIRRRLRSLDQQALDQSLIRVEEQLEQEIDPEVHQQLAAKLQSLHVQCEVREEHRQSLWRIESELEAARQTLGAVDAGIHQVDHLLASPSFSEGPGALPARADLQARVTALATAVTDVSGGGR
jgi:hypothetical protein